MHPHKSTTTPEKFFHFPDLQLWADVVHDNSRKYTPKAATAFCRKVQDRWLVSFAFCHPNDQFSRARGRTLSRRKFFQSPVNINVGTEISYDIVETALYAELDQ